MIMTDIIKKVFIDGHSGTVGLSIYDNLQAAKNIELCLLPERFRKDIIAKKDILSKVDVAILCLPNEASIETVAIINSLSQPPKVLDASTAYRIEAGWTYGFAEMIASHSKTIAGARLVSNPGCYATGAIALLRPLIMAGLLPSNYLVTINGVSGYSGGGRAMIAQYDNKQAPDFKIYGLNLLHKHIAEIQFHSMLDNRPIFIPAVSNFYQGMLVTIPLFLDIMQPNTCLDDIYAAYISHYNYPNIRIYYHDDLSLAAELEPQALNNSNDLELHIFANKSQRQLLLVARLDNLGKGAAGAALQNLALMLGC